MDNESTVKDYLTVQNEGTREVQRKITVYKLDMILAIGYRVRSARGAQFRRYASTVLKEYLIEGAALDTEKLTSNMTYFKQLKEETKKS